MDCNDRPFKRVVCIGLDGATFDVIDPMIAKGRLPVLAKVLSTGVRARLASTLPPLSAPAWVSFMTGLNPGRHGVFHFRAMERGALGAGLVGSWAFRGQTIFDHACRAGLKVVAFRVPMTFPAWALNGVMVSGFPTPDPRQTYSEPPEVAERIGPLLKLGPASLVMADVNAQVDNFHFHHGRATQAVLSLLKEEDPDLFCYVNSVTDWMAHKFWRYSDPSAPAYEPRSIDGVTLVEHFYEQADASLGDILEAVDGEALIIVLSDHGMGPRSTRRFNTNAWLSQRGWLVRTSRGGPQARIAVMLEAVRNGVPNKTALKQWLWKVAPPLHSTMRKSSGMLPGYGGPIEWSRSKAYRVALHDLVEGVNINLIGREPQGVVPESEYESVRQAVVAAAKELLDASTGLKVFEAVHCREDVYSGKHAHLAPDIILVLNPAYEFGPGTQSQVFSSVRPSRMKRSSANHRPDGVLAIAGPGVNGGLELESANLLDVPATILWALGVEIPETMDGRVLLEAFGEEVVTSHPVRRRAGAGDEASGGAYSKEEQSQMEAHLSDLGYL